MNDRIDIREPLRDICDRLGLVYENVARLELAPHIAQVDVYLLNEEGKKYVNLETDEVAVERREMEVAT